VDQILALLSWQPAAIAGCATEHGGPIAVGRPANLCVIDTSVKWVVEPSALASRSRNTPYAGRALVGRNRHTVLRGEPVVIDGEARRWAAPAPTRAPAQRGVQPTATGSRTQR